MPELVSRQYLDFKALVMRELYFTHSNPQSFDKCGYVCLFIGF
jgi:hypothetical protein